MECIIANVIIIGNVPAGISTALYTTRAGISTTIIGKDHGALGKASEIENYYGFSEPISGKDLISEGIEGARRLGAEIVFYRHWCCWKYRSGKKISAETQNNKIIVDENMSTNIPGLYATGDCTGGLLQISKAVYEGAKAGTEIIKYLRNNSQKISA